MTQTIDQRARELLAKRIGILATQEDDDSPYIAAITEALSRAETAERERDEARNANCVYDDATLDRELTDPLGAYKYGKAIGKETLHRVREERDEALTRVKQLEGALRQKRDMLNLARQLLGPKGAEIVTRLIDGGAMGFHASWGEDAHTLSGEQRADVLLQFMDAPSAPLEFNDGHTTLSKGIT